MSNEKEKAFVDWKALAPRGQQEEWAWLAGWCSAFEARPVIVDAIRSGARQVERSEIQKRIREISVAAFVLGHDEEATRYRELANLLFGKPV